MKQILIMRHAKSDWDSGANSDFERPLNKRGINDAPFMGEFIKSKNLTPDLILSSPATRAKETSSYLADKSEYQKEIEFVDDFYFGNITTIIEKLQSLPDEINSVMIIGHNPTWENFIELLSDERISVTMPTAAIACITVYESWSQLEVYRNKLDWIVTPKSLKE